MDSFVTWESLLTFGGCVAGTILVTEFIKKLFGEKVPAQLVSFLIAAVILFVGHLATGTFVWKEALLYLINAAAVSLSATVPYFVSIGKSAFTSSGSRNITILPKSQGQAGTKYCR